MKRMRIVGLALVAVFALSVVASSATASPVFYTKVAMGGTASTPVKFTGALGPAFLEGAVSKSKIECSAGTASGEVTGPTTTKNNITKFTGCKASGFPCNSTGAGEGEIVTKKLEGELGDVKVGTPGVRLFDEGTGKGGELAAFSCAGGAIAVKVKGSVIGQLSGAAGNVVSEGKFASSNTLAFAEAAGIQKFNKFVGEVSSEQLEAKVGEGAYEKSGQSVSAKLKAEGVSNLGFTK
jgi:hypothetical protein